MTTDDAEEPGIQRVTVTPRANGPVLVEGAFLLTAPDGTVTLEDRIYLCRCGRSADKPRCDGTHKDVGFEAPGATPTSRRR